MTVVRLRMRTWEEPVLLAQAQEGASMNQDWVTRILRTLDKAEQPLRAQEVAMRCGCLYLDQSASVRHALRRL